MEETTELQKQFKKINPLRLNRYTYQIEFLEIKYLIAEIKTSIKNCGSSHDWNW